MIAKIIVDEPSTKTIFVISILTLRRNNGLNVKLIKNIPSKIDKEQEMRKKDIGG